MKQVKSGRKYTLILYFLVLLLYLILLWACLSTIYLWPSTEIISTSTAPQKISLDENGGEEFVKYAHQDVSEEGDATVNYEQTATVTQTPATSAASSSILPSPISFNSPYLFINRHFGVSQDLRHATRHLNISLVEINAHEKLFENVTSINTNYLSQHEADFPQVQEIAQKICKEYEVVIVGDVNADARFLLQWIDKDPSNCTNLKRLIMLTTNRFDYHDWDTPLENGRSGPFHDLVKRVSKKQHPDTPGLVGPAIYWIANNPYEPIYASHKLGGVELNV